MRREMRRFGYLRQLSDEDVSRVHEKAIEMLENFGIRVEDEGVRDVMARSGGGILPNGRVSVRREAIERAMNASVPEIKLSSLSGAEVSVGEGLLVHSTGGAPWIIDSKSGARRDALASDLADAVRLMNAVDGLDLPCALVYPSDVPVEISQFLQSVILFRNSEKPVYCPGVSTPLNAKYIAEIFKALGDGERNVGMVGVSPTSPLIWPKEITDTARILSEAGVPISVLAAPIAGMTAPFSVVGCVAVCHAEILAFAAFCKLVNPKVPLVYGARPFFAGMRVGQVLLGLPETGAASGMAAQMAALCGMPSDVYGMAGTGCGFDEQTGYEKMMNGLLPALSGASMITGLGGLGSAMCGSLEQIVIDGEIARMIKNAAAERETGDDALGMEEMGEVLEEGGSFMDRIHTVERLRKGEVFEPRLGFADGVTGWYGDGRTSLGERAACEARKVLAAERRPVMSDAQENELAAITRSAEREASATRHR
ncbi:MAG: trimethylamine methyltransferase family protein [Synergistaceae bacterium]|jgi:trimethylamine--corrinoid protein Co-methyltransferase|nr:trimethylamine methyltransferase family protein [Synergistaceae bacterium]